MFFFFLTTHSSVSQKINTFFKFDFWSLQQFLLLLKKNMFLFTCFSLKRKFVYDIVKHLPTIKHHISKWL